MLCNDYLAHCCSRFQNSLMNLPLSRLQDAAAVLDALASGRLPDRTAMLSAALDLNTYCQGIDASRDLLDAAAGLETLATGGTLDLDATARQRALKLAQVVRQAMS